MLFHATNSVFANSVERKKPGFVPPGTRSVRTRRPAFVLSPAMAGGLPLSRPSDRSVVALPPLTR